MTKPRFSKAGTLKTGPQNYLIAFLSG